MIFCVFLIICLWYQTELDMVGVEKRNLVALLRLVVRDVIESSMKLGRMLDSDHIPLQHFLIVMEHSLKHGLKNRRGLLGGRKELWDVLQLLDGRTLMATETISSVRQCPTVRTNAGRSRVWLRLSLMQKRLAEYVQMLMDMRDKLQSEYYEPCALMMTDDAIAVQGLLLGLNVIDSNLCVKEEELDVECGVMDLTGYLKSQHESVFNDVPPDSPDMDVVLDQKNYIEELNRHLNSRVTILQKKVETLTEANAQLKEELARTRATSFNFQDEVEGPKQSQLRLMPDVQLESPQATEKCIQDQTPSAGEELTKMREMLEEARREKETVSKELEIQVLIVLVTLFGLTMRMKTEMGTAMRLLEKDIHEKQDTVVSLRRQLDDIKNINLEMYRKLQECETSMRSKSEILGKLDAANASLALQLQSHEALISELEEKRVAGEEECRKLGLRLAERERQCATLETDLKVEREWRQALQESSVKDRDRAADLLRLNQELQVKLRQADDVAKTRGELETQVHEYEKALEEMGIHLQESKLKVEDLREASQAFRSAQWASDKDATHCRSCEKEFNLARRKHHCRFCGEIFCKACSDNTMPLPSSAKPVRVCDSCHALLLQRFSAPSTR
ncbi:unnamed protein product [Darwinula stevensoni]|uniref:Uncharacterized protein n=1 Tax=Darwinula stevensoni TaxID=69355 RepID=A0A7R9FPQ2_9CRUS|nr:unnamed protein product [Darwinula stevensoni]CAG0897939.1 unnamed protein product [Darwinula stevensoni]